LTANEKWFFLYTTAVWAAASVLSPQSSVLSPQSSVVMLLDLIIEAG